MSYVGGYGYDGACGGKGFYGGFTSASVILVLFILLVIVTRSWFL